MFKDVGNIQASFRTPLANLNWWDKTCFSKTVVVQDNHTWDQTQSFKYLMYYYGWDLDLWARGMTLFNPYLPTSRVGMAISQNGLFFT
jgi:hypothetical protein